MKSPDTRNIFKATSYMITSGRRIRIEMQVNTFYVTHKILRNYLSRGLGPI